MKTFMLVAVALIVFQKATAETFTLETDTDVIRTIYHDQLLVTISDDKIIEKHELEKYFTDNSIHLNDNTNVTRCFGNNGTTAVNVDCLLHSCLSPSEVLALSGLADSKNVTYTELSTLSAILLHVQKNTHCLDNDEEEEPLYLEGTTKAEAWGYSFVFVTVINLSSLGGLLVIPLINHAIFKTLIIFMVALAVGTLTASSLLFLIPEALELAGEEDIHSESFLWKTLTVVAGIYLFFFIERVLKILTYSKLIILLLVYVFTTAGWWVNSVYPDQTQILWYLIWVNTVCSSLSALIYLGFIRLMTKIRIGQDNLAWIPFRTYCFTTAGKRRESYTVEVTKNDLEKAANNVQHETKESLQTAVHTHMTVKPVAWMIIIGDGLHNFIDGVSIGAAFTQSTLAGISVSVAIFCEELPHELGDFAILLHAGMKVKQAAMYNFLSACMCYVGMVIGIVLGENTGADIWVFAFAGGMFLYISLADMMPEMNSAGECEVNRRELGTVFIFVLQNLGLLVGFGLILALAVYGGNIDFQ